MIVKRRVAADRGYKAEQIAKVEILISNFEIQKHSKKNFEMLNLRLDYQIFFVELIIFLADFLKQ